MTRKVASKDEESIMNSESRSLSLPDEVREFKERGRVEVVNFKDGKIFGKGVFEPGWTWSNDVKPIAGTPTCQASHLGYCLKGSMEILMDDGTQFMIRAGDVFEIAPGHDARVTSQESCEMIDVGGFGQYAQPDALKKTA